MSITRSRCRQLSEIKVLKDIIYPPIPRCESSWFCLEAACSPSPIIQMVQAWLLKRHWVDCYQIGHINWLVMIAPLILLVIAPKIINLSRSRANCLVYSVIKSDNFYFGMPCCIYRGYLLFRVAAHLDLTAIMCLSSYKFCNWNVPVQIAKFTAHNIG